MNLPPATLSTKIKKLNIPYDAGTTGRPLYRKDTLLKYFPLTSEAKVSTTISIANQKGGESKTTLTQYLAQALSISGKKVLLIDMDPQASLTSNYIENPVSTIADLMGFTNVKKQIDEVIFNIESGNGISGNLDIIPSNIKLSAFSQILTVKDYKRLTKIVDIIRSRYDLILIDCPPSLGPLLDNALVASDKVLIPIQCREYSLLGVDLLADSIHAIKENLNPRLEILGAVLSMYNPREIMSEKKEEIKEYFPLLKTHIRHRVSIPQNQTTKENYFKTHPKESKMFLDLAREILTIILYAQFFACLRPDNRLFC